MTGKALITGKDLAGFESLLSSVHIERLDINPYAKQYLSHLLGHKKYYCRIYAQLLNLALKTLPAVTNPGGGLEKGAICLVDYGAGNGLLGLLAKYCGFGKVYLNDINAGFLHAARQLAAEMRIEMDGFIEGDISNMKDFFSSVTPDIIVGSDVIEHIYDLAEFFRTAKQINPHLVTVMSTACNPANNFKVKEFQKLQIKDELYGGSPADSNLFGETATGPFIETRKKIIAACANEKISREEMNQLAGLTRGLRKDDIEKAVEKYLDKKILPVLLAHPTNTCDPVSGSWSERLLSFEEYRNIYSRAGFSVEFYNGFYNEYEATLKSRMLFFANRLIPVAGHKLSPFITLVGRPKF